MQYERGLADARWSVSLPARNAGRGRRVAGVSPTAPGLPMPGTDVPAPSPHQRVTVTSPQIQSRSGSSRGSVLRGLTDEELQSLMAQGRQWNDLLNGPDRELTIADIVIG